MTFRLSSRTSITKEGFSFQDDDIRANQIIFITDILGD